MGPKEPRIEVEAISREALESRLRWTVLLPSILLAAVHLAKRSRRSKTRPDDPLRLITF